MLIPDIFALDIFIIIGVEHMPIIQINIFYSKGCDQNYMLTFIYFQLNVCFKYINKMISQVVLIPQVNSLHFSG